MTTQSRHSPDSSHNGTSGSEEAGSSQNTGSDRQVGKPYDLDALRNEATGTPFRFRLAGEVYTMRGPDELDWQLNLDGGDVESLRAMMRDALGEDQWERFRQHRVEIWRLTELLEACRRHYGGGPGESRASRRSSKKQRRK